MPSRVMGGGALGGTRPARPPLVKIRTVRRLDADFDAAATKWSSDFTIDAGQAIA
jgi:hypothetical protein